MSMKLINSFVGSGLVNDHPNSVEGEGKESVTQMPDTCTKEMAVPPPSNFNDLHKSAGRVWHDDADFYSLHPNFDALGTWVADAPLLSSGDDVSTADSSPKCAGSVPPPPAQAVGASTRKAKGVRIKNAPLDCGPLRRCCICLEDKYAIKLRNSGDFCGKGTCADLFCASCIRMYFTEHVHASRFALLPASCITCRGRVATDKWSSCVELVTFEAYLQSAMNLVQLRCPECDVICSLFEESAIEDCATAIAEFIAISRHPASMRKAWDEYEVGKITPGDFIDALIEDGPSSLQDHQVEQRIGKDGLPYELDDFLLWYGDLDGRRMWEGAPVYRTAKRLDEDASCFTLHQFEELYSDTVDWERWETTNTPLKDITGILLMIKDIERRAALQVAFLRRYPMIKTPCCQVPFCFTCQLGGWHEGQTCKEIQALEAAVDVQFCPGCGVPTQRTEGCSDMVCLCGKHWCWEGDSDYDSD